ncbi:hypothetical protein GOBAR_DD02565 [Gossypium barbadense]|nr:hypothetical protein GOBAR_DD02565 [Gossypium barbadense]
MTERRGDGRWCWGKIVKRLTRNDGYNKDERVRNERGKGWWWHIGLGWFNGGRDLGEQWLKRGGAVVCGGDEGKGKGTGIRGGKNDDKKWRMTVKGWMKLEDVNDG